MRDFLSKHQYLVVWVSGLIIVGAVAVLLIQMGGVIPNLPGLRPLPPATPAPAPTVTTPEPPSVTYTIQKSDNGSSFYIQWKNLPNGTVALNIFRGKTGTDPSTWLLWKTVPISPNELANGGLNIDLGNQSEDGYSFRTEAVGGGGGDNSLWDSSSTTPTVTTSTSPSGNTGTPSSTGNNPPPPPPTPDNNPPPSEGSSSTPTTTPPTPSGTPYYNPQIKISNYGTGQSGNFWVQHVDQKIEIGWQDLPSQTTSFIVLRSADQGGPWSAVFTEQDPTTAGPHTIQIVDNTFGQSYYYEMNATEGGTTLATYGPDYLAGN